MAAGSLRLDNVRVASPCNASWDLMVGTACVRYCTSCGHNVYNLSAMSREEAEALIVQKEGRLCVRFFQREDGKLLTQDCPVGLRTWRRRVRAVVTFAVGLLLMTFGLMAHSGAGKDKDSSITQVEPLRSFLDWLDPGANPPSIDPGANPPSNRPCIMGKM